MDYVNSSFGYMHSTFETGMNNYSEKKSDTTSALVD